MWPGSKPPFDTQIHRRVEGDAAINVHPALAAVEHNPTPGGVAHLLSWGDQLSGICATSHHLRSSFFLRLFFAAENGVC